MFNCISHSPIKALSCNIKILETINLILSSILQNNCKVIITRPCSRVSVRIKRLADKIYRYPYTTRLTNLIIDRENEETEHPTNQDIVITAVDQWPRDSIQIVTTDTCFSLHVFFLVVLPDLYHIPGQTGQVHDNTLNSIQLCKLLQQQETTWYVYNCNS